MAFGLAGFLFVIVTFVTTWDSSRGTVLPAWPTWLAAAAITTAGMIAAAIGWLALFEDGSRPGLISGFYAGQLGKYIPGGIWQAVGQISLTKDAAGSGTRAAVAFSVYTVIQVTSGLALSSIAGATLVDLPLWARSGAVAGLLALLLLNRRWMAALAEFGARRTRRLNAGLVPAQMAIVKSFLWAATTLIAAAFTFAILMSGLSSSDSIFEMALAFFLAWTVGYLAVPFPSGLGVREAVLVASLTTGAAPIIAASLAHRLVSIATEVVFVVATTRRPT